MNIAKNGSIEGNLFYYVQWMNQQYTHIYIYLPDLPLRHFNFKIAIYNLPDLFLQNPILC